MINGLFSSLSGLRAFSTKLQSTANNLANIQTSGFKKGRVNLTEVRSGGVQAASATRLDAQGSLLTTTQPVDLAIEGPGFFKVALPNGETGFTRAGNFKTDAQGRLVTTNGFPLDPVITVPSGNTAISISRDGEVSARVGGTLVNIGRIELANFNNPGGLTSDGGNVFLESAASGTPVTGTPGTGGLGILVSGALEGSNVDIAEEMVDQLITKTAFKANVNFIKAVDDLTGTLLDIKG